MIPDHWVATLSLQIKPNILWTRPLVPLKTWATIKIKWIQLSVLNKSINHASCIQLFSAEIGRWYWEHFVRPVIRFVQDAFVVWFLTAILIAATPAPCSELRTKEGSNPKQWIIITRDWEHSCLLEMVYFSKIHSKTRRKCFDNANSGSLH